ncbi:MAG: mechanosensitive ion channel family protein [Hydrococcus sp. Prado102]|nr:mechanosensitive ion channel family protein [Hydrococcus sp. Prado102]
MNTFVNLHRLIIPSLILLGSVLLGWLFEKQVIKRLKKITQRTNWKYDDIFLDSFQGIGFFWFILGGIYFSLPILPFNGTVIIIIQKVLVVSFLISCTIVVSRLLVKLLRLYTTRDDGFSPLTTLFEFLINVVIFSLGVLIALQSIGVAITPLLTAFGVGGVSIGLALQSTLSNLMSGINIITSKKVKPGDYIELKTGEAGYVTDVELKYTVIQEITNNFLVIPNSKILSSSFRNYSLPDKEMLIPIEVGVGYNSDLEVVEAVTIQVVKETMQSFSGSVPEYEPFIRYHKFDYFSINFRVFLKIKEQEYFEHLKIKHEFLKRLHKAYKKQGIEIPFPIKSAYIFNDNNNFPKEEE